MLEISLDDSDLQRGLGQLLRNARHPRPMMRAIAAELLSITEDNFESESWGGKKWPANARGGKILQKSGQLAASMTFMLRTAVFLFDGCRCGRGYLKTSGEDWQRAKERFSGSL